VIIILSIFLTGVLFWSLDDTSIKSLLSCSSDHIVGHEKSHTHSHDDSTEQLGKMLTWRKDRLVSLSKDNRRTIEEFLVSSDSRTKMTVDTFQRILDMLLSKNKRRFWKPKKGLRFCYYLKPFKDVRKRVSESRKHRKRHLYQLKEC
jgi:hypothetical protein